MNILITGGKGLIGTALTTLLTSRGHQVRHLSRTPTSGGQVQEYKWDISNNYIDKQALEGLDAIVHLAGESVAAGRWTAKQKEKIINSRRDSARLLFNAISERGTKPTHFISASGVGYYGVDTGTRWMTEADKQGDGFLAEVVHHWEASADEFAQLDIQVTKLRIGMVLSADGGALDKIVQPIKYGVGAPLGSGQQQISWIHIEDLARLVSHVMEGKHTGVYNAVSSDPVSNAVLTQSIARTLHKPLWLPNVPAFVLKMLLGEMSAIVLGGNRVANEKIKATGFRFEFESIDQAMTQLLRGE